MKRGFTLIELLVVITIIVVLLALLAPALDKAIYQAELAVCASRVRGIAQGAMVYAADQKRMYPFRARFRNGNHKTNRPNRLWLANGGNPPFDERKFIRPYVGSIDKQFQCPFLPEMDLDVGDIDSRQPGETGWASYQFWYGWSFTFPGEQGMFKLGNRSVIPARASGMCSTSLLTTTI